MIELIFEDNIIWMVYFIVVLVNFEYLWFNCLYIIDMVFVGNCNNINI